ncbi:MAG: Eco57I restriction-modification methylase domain-containing protein, partial [Promethearchaeota archaeon]
SLNKRIKIMDIFDIDDLIKRHGSSFDLIIGNPPWVTLKDLSTKARKQQALNLAKKLNITTSPHEVPQLELAAIVFTSCVNFLLNEKGSIFFVMTSSVLNGKHCSRFRSFNSLVNVEVWQFSGKKCFTRPFICILGAKKNGIGSFFRTSNPLRSKYFEISRDSKRGTQVTCDIKLIKESTLVPVNLEEVINDQEGSGEVEIGPFIETTQHSRIISTTSSSFYKKACYNGATIFPQSFFFVNVIEEWQENGGYLVKIRPALDLNMKSPWNFFPYKEAIVEKRYIFNLVKGTELYPFGTHEARRVFLPVIVENGTLKKDAARKSLGLRHFQHLDGEFQKLYSGSKRIKNLWDRINFDSALTNSSMLMKWKIVFPDCGSVMAAAIVPKNVIVEHALHYIGTNDELEAFYLMGVLNAPCIEDDLKFKKAERHIGQVVLQYSIPRFDKENQVHMEIARLSRSLSIEVLRLVETIKASKIKGNDGKIFCTLSKTFIDKTKLKIHQEKCTKCHRASKIVDITSLYFPVSKASAEKIQLSPTRRKIKKEMSKSEVISGLLATLNQKVISIL